VCISKQNLIDQGAKHKIIENKIDGLQLLAPQIREQMRLGTYL